MPSSALNDAVCGPSIGVRSKRLDLVNAALDRATRVIGFVGEALVGAGGLLLRRHCTRPPRHRRGDRCNRPMCARWTPPPGRQRQPRVDVLSPSRLRDAGGLAIRPRRTPRRAAAGHPSRHDARDRREGVSPGLEGAFEITTRTTKVPQPSRCATRWCEASLVKACPPSRDVVGNASHGWMPPRAAVVCSRRD